MPSRQLSSRELAAALKHAERISKGRLTKQPAKPASLVFIRPPMKILAVATTHKPASSFIPGCRIPRSPKTTRFYRPTVPQPESIQVPRPLASKKVVHWGDKECAYEKSEVRYFSIEKPFVVTASDEPSPYPQSIRNYGERVFRTRSDGTHYLERWETVWDEPKLAGTFTEDKLNARCPYCQAMKAEGKFLPFAELMDELEEGNVVEELDDEEDGASFMSRMSWKATFELLCDECSEEW